MRRFSSKVKPEGEVELLLEGIASKTLRQDTFSTRTQVVGWRLVSGREVLVRPRKQTDLVTGPGKPG